MKTLRVLFTIFVLSVFVGYGCEFAFASSDAVYEEDSSDWAFDFGQQFAWYGVEPVYALQVVAHMRTWDLYREGEYIPETDIGRRFWAGFRSINPYNYIIVIGSDDEQTPRYQALKGADLRGLDFSEIYFAWLDMTEAKFDRSVISGGIYACVLDKSSWQDAIVINLKISWPGEGYPGSSLQEAKLGMAVSFGTLSITHADMRSSDLSSLLLGQQHSHDTQEDESALVLRYCDITGANIPAAVYARASVMYCTGIVQADYEDGLRLANQTNTFVATPPAVPTPPIVNMHVNIGFDYEFTPQLIPLGATSNEGPHILITNDGDGDVFLQEITLQTHTIINGVDSQSFPLRNIKIMQGEEQRGTTLSTFRGVPEVFHFGNTIIIPRHSNQVLSVWFDATGLESHQLLGEISVSFHIISVATQGRERGAVIMEINPTFSPPASIVQSNISVIKNPAMGNYSEQSPTGVIYSANRKIASFVIIGEVVEGVIVNHIALQDVSTTYYVSNYFQNVRLMHGTAQLGNTLGTAFSGSSAVQTHTFSISPAITINAGEQYVVDIYADIKSNILTTATPIFKVVYVGASGQINGRSVGWSGDLLLQSQYIARTGSLMVTIDDGTPLSDTLIMGAVDQELAKFTFTASPNESIHINELIVSTQTEISGYSTLENIRLYDDNGMQIGFAAAGLDITYATPGYAYADFKSLNLRILRGSTRTISVKADITPFEFTGLMGTGQTHQLTIVPVLADGNPSITAIGVDSGQRITADLVNATANVMTLRRCRVTIAWDTDTPAGVTQSSSNQVIAKFTVTNLANASGYAAIIKALNFKIASTIVSESRRVLTVYKDSLTTTPLAMTNIILSPGQSNTTFTDADFTNVEITSGGTQTFYVTLDTSDASAGKRLTITIDRDGVEWSDGTGQNIIGGLLELPLAYRTLSY